jgi:methylated-DNA-[protein]-cysteine S-methyltransferase
MSTPLGDLAISGNDDGITGVTLKQHRDFAKITAASTQRDDKFDDAVNQLHEYFNGTRTDFDLPISQPGSQFQQEVWRCLTEIPFGQTRTYSDICQATNRSKAFQAVGSANGANKIAIIVPCHRVIGKNGKLTGYAGGLEAKAWLLRHEGISI